MAKWLEKYSIKVTWQVYMLKEKCEVKPSYSSLYIENYSICEW